METSKVQPKYHASQIAVNEPQAHTRVFLFHFLSERKKKILTEKKKQSERPILTALTQRLNSEIYLCCSLRHRQLLSLYNAPKQKIQSTVIPNNGLTTVQNSSNYDQFPILHFLKVKTLLHESLKISCLVF